MKDGAQQAAWPAAGTGTGDAGQGEEEAVASEALVAAHKGIGGSANLSLTPPSQVTISNKDLSFAMLKDSHLATHTLLLRIPFL